MATKKCEREEEQREQPHARGVSERFADAQQKDSGERERMKDRRLLIREERRSAC